MSDTSTVLEALEKMRSDIGNDIRGTRDALAGQIGEVSAIARAAKDAADEALQVASRVDSQVNGSLPPGANGPPYANGARPIPVVTRVSSAEGGLSEVVAQLADVKATLAKQNKTAGIADEAASLASKFYTFAMSREGVNFAIRLATLIAVGYFAFLQYAAKQSGLPSAFSPATSPPALSPATGTSP